MMTFIQGRFCTLWW